MIRVRHRRGDERGFTLIELMFAMAIFGVIVAIGVGPYRSYQRAQSHIATTRNIVAALRNAQIRAVAENTTYRITFSPDGRTYTRERMVGTAWAEPLVRRTETGMGFTGASFAQPDGSVTATCFFYARGAATKGSLTVRREAKSKTYNVTVEGLTARVSYS